MADPLGEPLAVAGWRAAMILEERWLGRPPARWAPAELDNFQAHIQVLSTWERRFGTRVVALKNDALMWSGSAAARLVSTSKT